MSSRLVKTVIDRAKKDGVKDDAIKVAIYVGADVFNGFLLSNDPAGGFAELEREDGRTLLISHHKIVAISPRWGS